MEMGKVAINLGTWTLPWKRREGAGIALFESRLRIAKKLPFWQTVGHGICPQPCPPILTGRGKSHELETKDKGNADADPTQERLKWRQRNHQSRFAD